MNDFDYEVLQRKRLAQQEKYRKNGSKSKKCTLPSDGMTRRQWKERNGEVITYNLNQPMSWQQFKELPDDIQKLYIEGLIDKYGVNATYLGQMFHANRTTVCNNIKNLGISFSRGDRMSFEQKLAFEKFVRGGELGEPDEPIVEESAPVLPEEPVTALEEPVITPPEPVAAASTLQLACFNLNFTGCFDSAEISRLLSALVPQGVNASIEIRCTIEKED